MWNLPYNKFSILSAIIDIRCMDLIILKLCKMRLIKTFTDINSYRTRQS